MVNDISRERLAAAIDAAEASTGHQILASVGSLGRNPARTADRVAARWPQASIIICLDLHSRRFELRWRDPTIALGQPHIDSFAAHLRNDNIEAALNLLARALPVQAAGEELPDVVG